MTGPPKASVFVHPTAEVSADAEIGAGSKVWNGAQIRAGAVVGRNCVIGKNVYIDTGVMIGNAVKIQNNVSIYRGVTIDDGVFCGPHCVFTNDLRPRAILPDGRPRGDGDWTVVPTRVLKGASIGANATIVCGVTIGRWAMVGAGAVVTRDVGDHALVTGNPARPMGRVCMCGARLPEDLPIGDSPVCPDCAGSS